MWECQVCNFWTCARCLRTSPISSTARLGSPSIQGTREWRKRIKMRTRAQEDDMPTDKVHPKATLGSFSQQIEVPTDRLATKPRPPAASLDSHDEEWTGHATSLLHPQDTSPTDSTSASDGSNSKAATMDATSLLGSNKKAATECTSASDGKEVVRFLSALGGQDAVTELATDNFRIKPTPSSCSWHAEVATDKVPTTRFRSVFGSDGSASTGYTSALGGHDALPTDKVPRKPTPDSVSVHVEVPADKFSTKPSPGSLAASLIWDVELLTDKNLTTPTLGSVRIHVEMPTDKFPLKPLPNLPTWHAGVPTYSQDRALIQTRSREAFRRLHSPRAGP